MNRLSNYFASTKLAKQYLLIAEENLRLYTHRTGEDTKTLRNLIRAQRELMTAMNNVASIAFNHKPKR